MGKAALQALVLAKAKGKGKQLALENGDASPEQTRKSKKATEEDVEPVPPKGILRKKKSMDVSENQESPGDKSTKKSKTGIKSKAAKAKKEAEEAAAKAALEEEEDAWDEEGDGWNEEQDGWDDEEQDGWDGEEWDDEE
eukprot:s1687_g18.t1